MNCPDDVALLSMRRQATSAGVHPSTMVRLAHALGLDSYNDFREPFQKRLRDRPADFSSRARDIQARGAGGEAVALMSELLEADITNLRQTFGSNGAEQFITCAETLSKGRRIFVVGLRSCFPVAFFFHYAGSMFRNDMILLDGYGGAFSDSLRTFRDGDVMFAVSFEPYSDDTVKTVEYAKEYGGASVVLTDSQASPLAGNADHTLIIRNDSPLFLSSIAAAMAAAEALVVLMVALSGNRALASIEECEEQLARFDAYWRRQSKRQKKTTNKEGNR